MPKTVEEVLRETGMTDEQIKALDPKMMTGLTTFVSSGTQALEAAELAKRAQSEQYENEIAPALDKWANDKAGYDAKMAAYEAALKSAKEGGFQIPEILVPPANPAARAADGKFVAGQNPVPGSPEFVSNLRKEAGQAIGSMLDLTWKYQTLYGKPMPDSPTVLIAEAQAQRLDPITYAAKKYDFAGKESAIKADEQKKHDDAIRAEAKAEADKVWAEKVGNNPMIRQAEVSKFATLEKAVKANERPDPLTMTREQRHVATRNSIQKELREQETVQ
jgi:hypothetical protein